MTHLILIGMLFFLSLILSFPLTRKPLSEDDGTWYYLAIFWERGVRLYKNFSYVYGYFGIPIITSVIYNYLGNKNIKSFQYFKAVWYSLTAISIYWLTYCFLHDTTFSFAAALIFIIITAIPNTLFALTYGEHFFTLPINLSIIFTYYGLATGSFWYFMLSGLMSAWAVQMKPPALLFGILLPVSFFYTTDIYLSLSYYLITFIGFNLLPVFILKKDGKTKYLSSTFSPVISLLIILLDRVKLKFLVNYIPESMRKYDAYIGNHVNKNLKIQWLSFKTFMLPAIKDLYLILILAAAQVPYLFIKFDLLTFSMILLFVIFLLTQQAQKNYYTPHFNPCWAPISILAAKSICELWPYLTDRGIFGWTIIALAGFGLIKIGKIIFKSFLKSERDSFGHLVPLIGKAFRLCESVGKYIQENSKESDKLFVWGDQPSIYLYSRREAFDPIYLIIYAHQGKILREKELLESLREKPPELLIFYNYKVLDGWNIKKLQETIGIPYKFMRGFQVTDDSRRNDKNPQGICFDFPLYRRDDEKYKQILLDRALIAKMNNDVNETKRQLENILEISPEDYEASIRLSLLVKEIVGPKTEQSYLDEELAENHDSIKNAILLRLLAEIDVDAGDMDSAVKNYEKALDSNLNDFRIHNGLGELSFSMDRIDDAFEYFKKAIILHPYSSDVLNNIGVLLSESGKRDDAIKYFKKALSYMPSHPDARKNMEDLRTV